MVLFHWLSIIKCFQMFLAHHFLLLYSKYHYVLLEFHLFSLLILVFFFLVQKQTTMASNLPLWLENILFDCPAAIKRNDGTVKITTFFTG